MNVWIQKWKKEIQEIENKIYCMKKKVAYTYIHKETMKKNQERKENYK